MQMRDYYRWRIHRGMTTAHHGIRQLQRAIDKDGELAERGHTIGQQLQKVLPCADRHLVEGDPSQPKNEANRLGTPCEHDHGTAMSVHVNVVVVTRAVPLGATGPGVHVLHHCTHVQRFTCSDAPGQRLWHAPRAHWLGVITEHKIYHALDEGATMPEGRRMADEGSREKGESA
jgi:hypothetical protein